MYKAHFLKGDHNLTEPVKHLIEQTAEGVYAAVHDILGLSECEIFVVVKKKRVIKGEMFREFLDTAQSCYLFVNEEEVYRMMDKDVESVRQNCAEHLFAGLYSTARVLHAGIGSDCGLLEEAVNEGLAGHFVCEMTERAPKEYYTALSLEQSNRLLKQMLRECGENRSDMDKWFWGSAEEDIPPHAALSLGYFIVGEVLTKTGGDSVAMLLTPARAFLNS